VASLQLRRCRAQQYAARNDAPGETLVRRRAEHVVGCGEVLI
jgi:hypothetical protein